MNEIINNLFSGRWIYAWNVVHSLKIKEEWKNLKKEETQDIYIKTN